ncbi:uncharacterized protein F5147DRAFT_660268 [Suillus discolor]|uniref:Uncharacterized protein n=1 Tax=Suillus discolor TaxID=1912936 RepID=A0A9P7ERJ1_9AGAM|nr:uncharacterized protein F5147DRAFT_660268 [Suillus discolor]KAG2083124.1 hypothetical protein F5147DRAFT_660268 [Suillus discolor]
MDVPLFLLVNFRARSHVDNDCVEQVLLQSKPAGTIVSKRVSHDPNPVEDDRAPEVEDTMSSSAVDESVSTTPPNSPPPAHTSGTSFIPPPGPVFNKQPPPVFMPPISKQVAPLVKGFSFNLSHSLLCVDTTIMEMNLLPLVQQLIIFPRPFVGVGTEDKKQTEESKLAKKELLLINIEYLRLRMRHNITKSRLTSPMHTEIEEQVNILRDVGCLHIYSCASDYTGHLGTQPHLQPPLDTQDTHEYNGYMVPLKTIASVTSNAANFSLNQIQTSYRRTFAGDGNRMKPLNELSDKAIKVLAKKRAKAEMQDICIRPLEQFPGPML